MINDEPINLHFLNVFESLLLLMIVSGSVIINRPYGFYVFDANRG